MGGKPRTPSRRHPAPLTRDEVVAERTYELVTESGEPRPVVVRIGKPRLKARPRNRTWDTWGCPLEIEGLEASPRRHEPASVDAISALNEALWLAHLVLRNSDAYRDGRLVWGGGKNLALPGRGWTGNVDVGRFFEDRVGYRALFACLLESHAPYPGTFRRLLARRLEVPLGAQPVDVVTELRMDEDGGEHTVDVVCYPHPTVILALDIVLDGAGAADAEPKLRALTNAERALAESEGRPPRSVHLVLIGAARTDVTPRGAGVVTALPWDEVFAMFERCDYLEGGFTEPVFMTLGQAAANRAPPGDREPPALAFPVGERIFEALRQARAEFQRRLDADPALAGTVWHCEAMRGARGDLIYGWFHQPSAQFQGRCLKLYSAYSENRWLVRIEVSASRNTVDPDPGWPARLRELFEQSTNLSWRPEGRRDERRRGETSIGHRFEVTDVEWPPKVEGARVAELVADGLMAYARAFHAYLSSER